MVEIRFFTEWKEFKEFVKPYKLADCEIIINNMGYFIVVDNIIGDDHGVK